MKSDIEELLKAGGGVLRRRDHRQLAGRLDRLRSHKELIAILPGVLVRPDDADDPQVRLRAGLLWLGPDALVTRHAAARLTFWPECRTETISFAVPRGMPRPQEGWQAVPPQMRATVSGVPLTVPSYTAVELAGGPDGAGAIDRVLRSRQATLESLYEALAAMPGRAGNNLRVRLLRDSRDASWSELERQGHRLLRRHRISGWRTNVRVETAASAVYADVLFEAERLVVEFDGWEFHSDREAFETDRRRRNELVLAGYTVLNFTWRQVTEAPDWVIDCIRRGLGR